MLRRAATACTAQVRVPMNIAVSEQLPHDVLSWRLVL
jgi:hypothetical protein